ncbi:4344_t:CDS:2 [Funneliformis caledonium]|uniref:4344_t:CDS:1 n=1 Tax=Funneliformis caledonium TaxID=1117310 RepID=A0A9N9HWX3_9GLOM|nr:4344_t:CDS:2 [Funneliformis caledonium]
MSSKSLVILFHIFLIPIFQSTCPHSFPLTEQEAPSTEQDIFCRTHKEYLTTTVFSTCVRIIGYRTYGMVTACYGRSSAFD